MRRLSSSGTTFCKVIFPAVWLTGFGAGAIAVAFGAGVPEPDVSARIMLPVAWLFGLGIFWWLCFPLKHVWIGPAGFHVEGLFNKIDFPLSDVESVTAFQWSNPESITLTLKRPTEFGSSIRFTPSVRMWHFSPHPTFSEISALLEPKVGTAPRGLDWMGNPMR